MTTLIDMFRALADPTRLRIARLARNMELTVGELAHVLDQSQPRVSRHVRILAEADLIDRRKEGSWVFVRFADGELAASAGAMLAHEGDPEGDVARLEAVRADRVAAAEDYFAQHASNWDRLRMLHVSDNEVETAIQDMLAQRPLGALMDIGTGTGRMLELLAPKARSAIGIDRSAEMLRAARGKLEAAGLGHCPVRQGDMFALPARDASVNTIVLHQVLHFAHRPELAIAEAARVLAPGGRLLVADFAPHDHEELRRDHAHARLGFADDAVNEWMAQAGLIANVPEHLEGKLTVTIWLGEKPALEAEKAA
ncbi:metalloregulator ArsR/SmtB family transcription factor [Pacificimonas sp. WHA3]|uniref:Metalloregulator ArsR/SmtB family transcription factor n=1 Tax=Pacificimonas pallii TaxID=2827236 RepID=A0ABS6SD78_9SPHN|nr:metalloregulator ArsR/SmtB family transcription factor [Pacificimonas pallii]MBV7256373.1 metalloregulator ArsR/SmtB family transcription factor [Pacificimonas pallii]